MSKVDIIIEQTNFLLDSQKASLVECKSLFAEFIQEIEKHLKNAKNKEDTEILERILNKVQEQAHNLVEDLNEDNNFIAEQLKMLQKIKSHQNQKEAEEMLHMMIDVDNILDIEDFKKSVKEETLVAHGNLRSMIDDLVGALEEGGAQEVLLLLEALNDLGDTLEEDEFLDEDEWEMCDDEECDDSSCSGCSSSCSDCGSSKVDIFEAFSKLAQKEETKKKN